MKKILTFGLLILLPGLAVLFFVLNPNEHEIFPRCLFNSLTGYYCPGCGSQRAIHSLLHFDISGVVGNNFLFLPAVLIIVYHFTHPFLNKTFRWNLPNILYMKITPLIVFIVVVLFGILRNLPYYPFSVLAPN